MQWNCGVEQKTTSISKQSQFNVILVMTVSFMYILVDPYLR